MKNKLRISPLFARGGIHIQHRSLQSGNMHSPPRRADARSAAFAKQK